MGREERKTGVGDKKKTGRAGVVNGILVGHTKWGGRGEKKRICAQEWGPLKPIGASK